MAKNAQQFEQRPWGTFEVLHEFTSGAQEFVIKKIVVYPGKRLSYQSHHHRQEFWFITEGHGQVTLNDEERPVGPLDKIDVPLQTKHRIANSGPDNLVFVEIGFGQFDEHDIVRYEGDFGRANSPQ